MRIGVYSTYAIPSHPKYLNYVLEFNSDRDTCIVHFYEYMGQDREGKSVSALDESVEYKDPLVWSKFFENAVDLRVL